MHRYKKLLICKANAMVCGLPVAGWRHRAGW
jgi:hypothetical protein